MAVSARLRFEIFRRDHRTCHHCGRTPPAVILEVDHVIPVALGGTDDPSNLQTVCAGCNSGKSSMPADAPLVQRVSQDAARWAAAIERAAEELAVAERANTEIYEAFNAVWYRGNKPNDWTDSIDQFVKAGLPKSVIIKMAEVAQNKTGPMGYRWSYFCGCCWTSVRKMQDRALELLGDEEGLRG